MPTVTIRNNETGNTLTLDRQSLLDVLASAYVFLADTCMYEPESQWAKDKQSTLTALHRVLAVDLEEPNPCES